MGECSRRPRLSRFHSPARCQYDQESMATGSGWSASPTIPILLQHLAWRIWRARSAGRLLIEHYQQDGPGGSFDSLPAEAKTVPESPRWAYSLPTLTRQPLHDLCQGVTTYAIRRDLAWQRQAKLALCWHNTAGSPVGCFRDRNEISFSPASQFRLDFAILVFWFNRRGRLPGSAVRSEGEGVVVGSRTARAIQGSSSCVIMCTIVLIFLHIQ
jgi:hypothetical protein